jgi:Ca2+-binding RTX toxin-like protein
MNLTSKLLRYAGLGAAATLTAALAHLGPAGAATYPRQSPHIVDRTLVIAGTNGADDVVLSFPADGSAAVVDFADGYPVGGFDRKQFDAVSVFLGNGDDRFRVASGAPQTDSPITVDGGNGADTLFGGNAKDVLDGGRGDDVVNGKVGADTEFLGSGDDTALWVPGEGSDVVHGNRGDDTLGFDGGAGIDTMTLNANGEQSVFLRDPGTIRMDLDSVEALVLKPLGGADRLTINGTDAPEAVDVRADAGAVEVDGLLPRTSILGPEKVDVLPVNTLGGRDRVEVAPGVVDLITTSVDLGAGQ